MAPPSKTSFQVQWETEFSWVTESQRKGYTFCTVCKKDIYYESMGRTALLSHEKSKKHKDVVDSGNKSITLKNFFQPDSSNKIDEPTLLQDIRPQHVNVVETGHPSNQKTTTFFEKFKIKYAVTEAEILWCLHTVMQHLSLRNAESAVSVFKRMFACDVAQEMRLGKDKVGYSIVYGLGHYFKTQLLKKIQCGGPYVVLFDAPLNKVAQKQQLDICIRFWDIETDRAITRYLTSIFLLNTTAENLLKGVKEGLQSLNLDDILQISMDGPNVNKKLLRLLKEDLRPNDGDRKLLEIGSCGLHTINVAFKTGFQKTGWSLISFFRSSYYLFKNSPSHRATFILTTNSKIFPLKLYSVRWLEVAKRAQDILPNMRKYVDSVKGTHKEPSFRGFKIITAIMKDNLLPAKLAFFQTIAEDIEPFLKAFQGDAPMAPFLYDSLLSLVRKLMNRFVKKEILEEKLLENIDIFEKTNLKPAKYVDLGYATRSVISKCKGYNDKDLLVFRQECRDCLQHITKKIIEESPLSYPLTKAIAFLDPSKVGHLKEKIISSMRKTFDILLESNLLPSVTIEKADREFMQLLLMEMTVARMKSYSRTEERLDEFWISLLQESTNFTNLKNVIKILLTLSHGIASVERGFSVNGNLIVENLYEDSLVAQRMVYDSIKVIGGIDNFKMDKEIILSMRNAYCRWKEALNERRNRLTREEIEASEKSKAKQLLKKLHEKKRKIMDETQQSLTALDEEMKKIKRKEVVIRIPTAVLVNLLQQRNFLRHPSHELQYFNKCFERKDSDIDLFQLSVTLSSSSDDSSYVSRYLTDFEPVHRLGKGGFGVVFEAKNKIDDCHYAIKRIPLPNRQESRERVMREVKALAKLDHPYIVRYFNAWLECPPPGWQEKQDKLWNNIISDHSYGEVTSVDLTGQLTPEDDTEHSLKSCNLLLSDTQWINDLNPDDVSNFEAFLKSKPKDIFIEDSDSYIVFENSNTSGTKDDVFQPADSVIMLNSSTDESSEPSKIQPRKRPNSLQIDSQSNTSSFPVNSSRMYLFIQMQLCRKESLTEWLSDNVIQRDFNEVLNIFEQIVQAVEYVHFQGLIHRDLKPSNIFFSSDGQIKVGDFGLVTAMPEISLDQWTPGCDINKPMTDERHTAQVGTQLYMSPEQLSGRPYNYKVDIYSLGLILFELLVPFNTRMERIRTLTDLRHNKFPADFQRDRQQEYNLLRIMLSHNPEERLTTIGIRARPPLLKLQAEASVSPNNALHFELPAKRKAQV